MLRLVTYLMPLFWLCSCVPSQNIFTTDISGPRWEREVHVKYDNQDTLALKDIYLVARYTHEFDQQEIALELKVLDPSGLYIVDSITMPAAATKERFGQSVMHYRSHSRLSLEGDYTFIFSPLTRPTEGIAAVGIIID